MLNTKNRKRFPSRQFWDRRRWKSGSMSIVIWDCGRWKSGPCLLGYYNFTQFTWTKQGHHGASSPFQQLPIWSNQSTNAIIWNFNEIEMKKKSTFLCPLGNVCWRFSKYNNSSIFVLVFDFINVLHFCVILNCLCTLYCDKLIGIMKKEINKITWTLCWSVCMLTSSINIKWNEYYCSMNGPHIHQD